MDVPEVETKPYPSGWRNKVTGTIYRNATTQTAGSPDKKERTVQTDFLADKSTEMEQDVAVQTNPFPDVRDRIVVSSPNGAAYEEHPNEKILRSVVKIQKFYRVHRDRRLANRSADLSPRPWNRESRHLEVPEATEPGSYSSRDFVILNRRSPRSGSDFELLHNLLDRWRIRETDKVGESLFEPSRIALGSFILSKEVELLRAIEALKTHAGSRRRERSYRRFLDDLSEPVRRWNRRGEPIYVETARVRRARDLRRTFDALSRVDAPVAERKRTLIGLRKDIEVHTCKESDRVIRLVDQEIDFLNRGVDEAKLNWLRCRLNMSFLALARQALRHERGTESVDLVASRTDNFRRGESFCKSCGKSLSANDERKLIDERPRRSSTCRSCLYRKVRTSPGIVPYLEPYRKLLRDVRRHEARLHCYTSPAFVIDPMNVYHLVNDIWHGKSAISGNDRIEELRLARFRNGEEWSPWNCLLLTAREASLHRKLDDPANFYGPMILQNFHTKNLQAKVQFAANSWPNSRPTARKEKRVPDF